MIVARYFVNRAPSLKTFLADKINFIESNVWPTGHMQPWVAKKGLKMSKIQLAQFTEKMQKYSIINDFYKCVNTRKFAQVTNTTRNSYRHHPLCGVDSVHVRIL